MYSKNIRYLHYIITWTVSNVYELLPDRGSCERLLHAGVQQKKHDSILQHRDDCLFVLAFVAFPKRSVNESIEPVSEAVLPGRSSMSSFVPASIKVSSLQPSIIVPPRPDPVLCLICASFLLRFSIYFSESVCKLQRCSVTADEDEDGSVQCSPVIGLFSYPSKERSENAGFESLLEDVVVVICLDRCCDKET